MNKRKPKTQTGFASFSMQHLAETIVYGDRADAMMRRLANEDESKQRDDENRICISKS